MNTLKALLGDSYQTKLWGIMLLCMGIVCITLGGLLKAGELTAAGLAMIPAGVGFLLTRSEGASVAAHKESMQGIAGLEEKHEENKEKIEATQEKVEDVKAIVSEQDTRRP